MSENKIVSTENAEIYDYLAHEYGYSIEYIKSLDILTITHLIRSSVKRKRKDLIQSCNLIRTAVWGDREVKESDMPEENNEDSLRVLIKSMTKASDEQIDEMRDKHIEVPI